MAGDGYDAATAALLLGAESEPAAAEPDGLDAVGPADALRQIVARRAIEHVQHDAYEEMAELSAELGADEMGVDAGLAPPTCADLPACDDGERELILNQRSVSEWVGREVGRWRAANEAAGRAPGAGAVRKPAARRGLLCCHNVGAGKSAITIAAAVAARKAWGDVTSIYVGGSEKVVDNFNAQAFPEDVGMINPDARGARGTRHTHNPPNPMRLKIGKGRTWTIGNSTQDSVYSYGNVTAIKEFRNHGGRGDPAFVAMSIDNIKNHATPGRWRDPAHWPQRPIVMFVDEAHLLAGEAPNHKALRAYLEDVSASPNVYCVLLTATPASDPAALAKLSRLVVAPANRRACDAIADPTAPTEDVQDYIDAMRGCVDVWMALGDTKRYPELVDGSAVAAAPAAPRRGYRFWAGATSPARLPAPSASAVDAQVYVQATCARGSAGDASRVAELAGEEPFASLFGTGRGAAASLARAVEVLAAGGAAAARAPALRLLAAARSVALVGETSVDPAVVRDKAKRSRADLVAHAADGVHELPDGDTALYKAAPKLAMLAHRVLRADPGATGRTPPRFKQVIMVPISQEEQRGYPIVDAVTAVLEGACGLLPLSNRTRQGRKYAVLQGDASGLTKRFNAPDNRDGRVLSVLVVPTSDAAVSYSLDYVRRIHIMEWTDVATMSQAVGRAQRSCKSEPGEALVAFTYSACMPGSRATTHENERAAAERVRGLSDALAAQGVDLDSRLDAAHRELSRRAVRHGRNRDYMQRVDERARRSMRSAGNASMGRNDVNLAAAVGRLQEHERRSGQSLVGEMPDGIDVAIARARGNNKYFEQNAEPGDWSAFEAMFAREPAAMRPFAEPVHVLTRDALAREQRLAATYGALRDAAHHVNTWRLDNEAGRIDDDASVDEMLAAIFARRYEPVNRLMRALAAASNSCRLYEEVHRECGAVPGVQGAQGYIRDASCDAAVFEEAEGDDGSARRIVDEHLARLDDAEAGSDADLALTLKMVNDAMVHIYTSCAAADEAAVAKCEARGDDGELGIGPRHPGYRDCLKIHTCSGIKVVEDTLGPYIERALDDADPREVWRPYARDNPYE